MSTDHLSPWAKNIAPSPTLAVDAKAKALKAAGEDVCGFGAGEPDFDTPQFIKDACTKALADGKTKYAAAPGLPELRQALAEQYYQHGVIAEANPAQVVVSPGGKYSCYLAILATCGPGDEVLIPAPYWVSYPEMVKLAGAIPKIVFAGDDQGFKVTPEQIEDALTPATKLLILNSPSNPTGCLYDRAEMEAMPEPFPDFNKRICVLNRGDNALRERIQLRTSSMLANGLVDEVRGLLSRGLLENPTAAASIGYREVIAYIQNKPQPEKHLEESINRSTWQLVRKQKKWFRSQMPCARRVDLDLYPVPSVEDLFG